MEEEGVIVLWDLVDLCAAVGSSVTKETHEEDVCAGVGPGG